MSLNTKFQFKKSSTKTIFFNNSTFFLMIPNFSFEYILIILLNIFLKICQCKRKNVYDLHIEHSIAKIDISI